MRDQPAITASLCVILLLLSAGCEQTTSSGYTVIFDSQEADIAADPDTMKADLITKLLPEMPTDPEKYGCTFSGWWTAPEGSGEPFFLETSVRYHTVVYAFWELESYTISYQLNGGTNVDGNPDSYTVESASFVLQQPIRDNYRFLGWFETGSGTSGTAVTEIPAGSTGDISLEARWDAIDYTISYVLNGGTNNPANPATYTTSDTIDLADPAKADYTFLGWYDPQDTSEAVTQIPKNSIGDVTLVALWEETRYHITYNLDGGDNNVGNPSSFSIHTAEIVLLEPTKLGYSFEGWYLSLEGESPIISIPTGTSQNMTLYAKWSINYYKMRFNANGGSEPPYYLSVNMFMGYNKQLFTPKWKYPGYYFSGWARTAIGPVEYEASDTYTMGAENVTMYAQWEPVRYSITYQLAGGTNDTGNPVSYSIESGDINLAVPVKNESTFLGWFTSSVSTVPITEIPSGSTGNLTLTARWQNIDYSITYNLDGGTNSSSNPGRYSYYSDTILLSDPEKSGYDFLGWYISGSGTPGTEVTEIPSGSTGDVTLEARWELQNYTISYEVSGGTNSSSNPDSYTYLSDAVTFSDPGRTGYTFLGWYVSGSGTPGTEVTEIPSGSTGDVTLEARWELASYTISYELNGGTNSSSNPDSYTYLSDAVTFLDPGRTGYSFLGWYISGSGTPGTEVIEIPSGSTGDVTLEARWELQNYTISYELNGGTNSSSNPDSYTYLSDAITFSDPGRTGYTFLGWFETGSGTSGAAITEIPVRSTGSISLEAHWEINVYTVTYHSNSATSGSVPDSQTHSYGSYIQLLELDPDSFPLRTGYMYTRWNTAPDGSGTDYNAGVWDSAPGWHNYDGNLDLYAKWTPLPHYLKFNANGGGSESMERLKVASDESITLPEVNFSAPSKYHYFAGWAESTSGPVVYTNKDSYTMAAHQYISTEITLYAKWNLLQVGDRGPGGGFIFYDKGNASDGWRYKEAADKYWASDSTWFYERSHNWQTSKSNCENAVINGYDNWYLHTKDDLVQIWTNLWPEMLGGFVGGHYFWSSTKWEDWDEGFFSDELLDWGYYVVSGNIESDTYTVDIQDYGYYNLGLSRYYRPVRKF